ncbi:MAG: ABC transporter substrate-binding protein [Thermomicrobiales bacterium]|nr:ABC transporter substrate-binding protein [Thermomicrobiales bacterium]
MQTSRHAVRLRIVVLFALLVPLLMVDRSGAQEGNLVVATWGGAYSDAFREAFGDPFSQATGTTVQFVDAPGGFNAMLEAQAAADNVTWDVVDLGEEDAVALIDAGLLQPLPDDLKAELIEAVGTENVTDYGISFAAYGSVIACNAAVADACPTTPAEFWDVENFPGRRTMYGDGWSDALIYALLADGVAKEDLFPLDVDRAFAKLDEIKPHIDVWWTTGDQSQQIFRDEEVVMGILWDGRASGLREQGVDVQLSFEGSPISRDLLVVPADAPNPEAAFDFLRWYATHPDGGAKWIEAIGYGVANPEAYAGVPAEITADMGASPENVAKGVLLDVEWSREHRDEVLPRWTEWLAS